MGCLCLASVTSGRADHRSTIEYGSLLGRVKAKLC
jgi:hypothetical protein